MAPIYSTQLANVFYAAPSAGAALYTVPVGSRVVLTDVALYLNSSAGGQESYVQLLSGGGVLIYNQSAAAEQKTLNWSGKQVLNAGDTIFWVSHADNSSVLATGYLLS